MSKRPKVFTPRGGTEDSQVIQEIASAARQINGSGIILDVRTAKREVIAATADDDSFVHDIPLVIRLPYKLALVENVAFMVTTAIKKNETHYWTAEIVYIDPDLNEDIIGDSASTATYGWTASAPQVLGASDFEMAHKSQLRLRLTASTSSTASLRNMGVEAVLWKGALSND